MLRRLLIVSNAVEDRFNAWEAIRLLVPLRNRILPSPGRFADTGLLLAIVPAFQDSDLQNLAEVEPE